MDGIDDAGERDEEGERAVEREACYQWWRRKVTMMEIRWVGRNTEKGR